MEKTLSENKMGVMPIGKLLFTMSAPMVASMLFQAFYNIVDSMFVARLSQDAMNAVSLAFPIHTLEIAFSGGTGVGINAYLSRSLGEKDYDKVNRIAGTGIFLYICTALAFAGLGLLVAGPYYRFQTTNETIVRYGTAYVSICTGLAFALFAQMCSERLLQATGRTNLAMIPQITGAVINMVMDPILIFGLFGFPRLEVAGAAVATVIGQSIAAVIGFTLNIRKNPEIRLSGKLIRPNRRITAGIYRIGVPSIIMQISGSVMNFGLNKILIGFTEAATAALGAYYKIQSFIFMPVMGMNNALVPIVSYNLGAGKKDRVKKTAFLSMGAAVCIMIIGTLLFELIPGTLLGIFTPSEELLRVGIRAFRIIAVHFPVAAISIVSISLCQAMGKPMFALITSVCRSLVFLLPSAYLLSLTGVLDNVWYSFLIGELASIILIVIFLRKTFRENGLTGRQPA